MAFLNIPIKSIEVSITSTVGVESMTWYNPQDFPVVSGSPTAVLRDYRWRVVMNIVPQPQSSYITRDPGTYNGQDITVGQWIANLTTGQAWQVISIDSKTTTQVTAVVQDVYRYNTFRDVSGTGNGAPNNGVYVVFNLSQEGLPQIDPVPASGISATFTQNIQSRFEYINLQYDYPLYQSGNSFVVNDVIAVDSNTNNFVLSGATNKLIVGRVTSVSDTIPGWFTVNPVQKVVDFLDYLPGDVGDIIYSSTTTPGGITTAIGGAQLYIKLRNNTSSVSTSLSSGPTAPGNVFQVNGVSVTVGGVGSLADIISAVNSHYSATSVLATQVLTPTAVQTNSTMITSVYGEPALFAAASPAVATINGVMVTFNITSSEPGYTDYARPAQMAQSINNASVPGIVASYSSLVGLIITNTAGGPITITNITADSNGVHFAGANSGSGLATTTSASTSYRAKFVANDARPVNFIDVVGTTVDDFGLVSVENGTKASGLYIEDGLRAAASTVVTSLVQLNAMSPMIGDQAYVIDSNDGQGNNVGEWSLWIYNGTTWVETANQDSAETDAKSLERTLTVASSPITDIGEISTGRRVTLITVEILTPFDAPATLSVGYLINNPVPQSPVVEGLMPSALIDLTTPGTYTTTTDVLFGIDTVQGDVMVKTFLTLNGATVGSAQIIVSYV